MLHNVNGKRLCAQILRNRCLKPVLNLLGTLKAVYPCRNKSVRILVKHLGSVFMKKLIGIECLFLSKSFFGKFVNGQPRSEFLFKAFLYLARLRLAYAFY